MLLQHDARGSPPSLHGITEGLLPRVVDTGIETVGDDNVVVPSAGDTRRSSRLPGLPRATAGTAVARPTIAGVPVWGVLGHKVGLLRHHLPNRISRELLFRLRIKDRALHDAVDVSLVHDGLLLVLDRDAMGHIRLLEAADGHRARPEVRKLELLQLHCQAQTGRRLVPDGTVERGGAATALHAVNDSADVHSFRHAVRGARGPSEVIGAAAAEEGKPAGAERARGVLHAGQVALARVVRALGAVASDQLEAAQVLEMVGLQNHLALDLHGAGATIRVIHAHLQVAAALRVLRGLGARRARGHGHLLVVFELAAGHRAGLRSAGPAASAVRTSHPTGLEDVRPGHGLHGLATSVTDQSRPLHQDLLIAPVGLASDS
mmetsp:Transcript_18706/g.42443  ORF Transcript_18706/g.42443 Transcript_18706/m.42443 type:complete len:376 (-) Transcript_18706:146-1273(-)